MIPQQFYMIHVSCELDKINLRSDMIKILPILWNRDGEYRLVPKEVVQNAINSVKAYSKMAGKITHPIVCIYWDQGVPVDNQVGRMLSGE